MGWWYNKVIELVNNQSTVKDTECRSEVYEKSV